MNMQILEIKKDNESNLKEMKKDNESNLKEMNKQISDIKKDINDVKNKIQVGINTASAVGVLLGIFGIANIGSLFDLIKKLFNMT